MSRDFYTVYGVIKDAKVVEKHEVSGSITIETKNGQRQRLSKGELLSRKEAQLKGFIPKEETKKSKVAYEYRGVLGDY